MKEDKRKFAPDIKQLAFAQAYVLNKANVEASCRTMAMREPETTPGTWNNRYYNQWVKQEGFEDWLSEYTKREVMKHVGKWYAWAEKYAERGSFQHLNLLMQIAKEFAPGALIDQSQHIHYEWSDENLRKTYSKLQEIRTASKPVDNT